MYEMAHGSSIYDDLGIEENFGTFTVDSATLSRVISRVEQVSKNVGDKDAMRHVLGFLQGCRDFCQKNKVGLVYMLSID